MKHRMALNVFTSRVRHDIEDLREVIDLTESYLKREIKRLEEQVAEELSGIPDKEEKDFTIQWYVDDFVRLDKVYPNIQRRALFMTLMCMMEADLFLGCRMCKRAFEISQEFKTRRNARAIVQAMDYLKANLIIRDLSLKPHWDIVQNLWSIRNSLVHNDGKPRTSDLPDIGAFCAEIPTLELDHLNRIILKEGSVEMALHSVELLFSRLIDEIKRNELPNQQINRIQ